MKEAQDLIKRIRTRKLYVWLCVSATTEIYFSHSDWSSGIGMSKHKIAFTGVLEIRCVLCRYAFVDEYIFEDSKRYTCCSEGVRQRSRCIRVFVHNVFTHT